MRRALCRAPTYLVVLAVQPLHLSDGAERKGEAISAGTRTVRLAREERRRRETGGLQEARRRGREADVRLGQVQLADVVPAPVVVLVARYRVRGRDGQLRVDLVEGRLRRRQPELALEQGRLGRVLVRLREIEPLRRVD